MKETLSNLNLSHLKTVLTLLAVTLIMVGCTKGEVASKSDYGLAKYDVNKYALNKTVCDPFGGDGTSSPEKGIKAELFYRSPGMPRYYTAQEYIDNTTKSSQNLFFTELNAPTRMFSAGFSTLTSDVVNDDSGNKLIEYFGLKFSTNLRLSQGMDEGDYELASLADDGMVVKIKVNGAWVVVSNNDGDHPTRMGCSNQYIHMDHTTSIPVEITYYQGPRFHIAAVLIWRMAPSGVAAGSDAYCGNTGNEYWFNPNLSPNDPAYVKQPVKDLYARGWMPIMPDNYFINSNDQYNPCYEGVAPVISDFRLVRMTATSATFSWTTDLPSTSQILLTEVSSGTKTMSATDNVLRTEHTVTVTDLTAFTNYLAAAVSVTNDLGKSISNEIPFRTPLE